MAERYLTRLRRHERLGMLAAQWTARELSRSLSWLAGTYVHDGNVNQAADIAAAV